VCIRPNDFMKITINVTKKEKEHLDGCNSYHDACGEVIDVMEKVKKELLKSK